MFGDVCYPYVACERGDADEAEDLAEQVSIPSVDGESTCEGAALDRRSKRSGRQELPEARRSEHEAAQTLRETAFRLSPSVLYGLIKRYNAYKALRARGYSPTGGTTIVDMAETHKLVVTWMGGPFDGLRVPVDHGAIEYAVAYNAVGESITHINVQRYIDDPSYWLKDRSKHVATVRVFQIDHDTELPTSLIRWHERNYRLIEVSSHR